VTPVQRLLLDLWTAGVALDEIADRTGLDTDAIRSALASLRRQGVAFRRPRRAQARRTRPCMICRRPFPVVEDYRICAHCKQGEDWAPEITEYPLHRRL